ncbi:hypothetical protein AEYBE204_10510 [Asticcacaulis sp. YBE204]|nr:hypothetical protein AEYBE204_10510 [Asticcacaulis sp. YBE204]
MTDMPLDLAREGVPEESWWTFTYSPAYDEQGHIRGLFCVTGETTAQVVSDRRRSEAEAARDAADTRLQLALSAGNSIGAWDWDVLNDTVTADARFASLYGLDPEVAATGAPIADFFSGIHPDDLPKVQAEIQAVIRGEGLFCSEYRLLGKDGSVRWVSAQGQGLFDDKGRCTRFPGVSYDITDRKSNEQRLAVSEASLRLATEAAEIGTWDLDLSTNTLTWSDRTRGMFGISPGLPCSMDDFYAGLHPDDLAATTSAFAQALDPKMRATYDVEYRTIGKEDRQVRWVAAKGKGLFDANGICHRALGTAIDITAAKTAQTQQIVLAELTDLLRSGDADGALHSACAIMGKHFGVQRVGYGLLDAVEDIFSYTVCWTDGSVPPLLGEYPAHAFGEQIVARLSRGETIVVDDLFASVISNEAETLDTAREVDTRAILVVPFLRGGRLRTIVYLNARGARSWTSSDVHFMELVAERTRQLIDRAESEALVRETAERYRLAAKATNDPIWDWDLTTNHVAWNDAIYDVFGYTPSSVEPTGDWWIDHVALHDRARISDSIHAVIDGKDDHWADTYDFLNAAGDCVPVFDRGYVLRDGQGKALRMIGAMLDQTERQRSEALLKQTNEDLEARVKVAIAEREDVEQALRQAQKMEAVGQLTGGIAHDFNNMLAVVLGSLELLNRRLGLEDARARHFVQQASDAAKRAANLTHRLLAFSRQQPLQPESLDPNRLVVGMSDLLRHSIGADIRLETVLGGGIWKVDADPNQLENVILNLAVNARDAMPDGGRLTIETQNVHLDPRYVSQEVGLPAGQYVMIAVSDTGAGMSPEIMAKAFDPFFTTKDVGKGTGLGLSQVYGFIKQSGGHVRIYSEIGHGTTLKIYLPRGEGASGAEEVDDRHAGALDGDPREVILVVDDEPAVRQFSVDALTELGYRVLQAESAAQALQILHQNDNVTLLFTDIIMPDVNGRKLVDEVMKTWPRMKVLYTTGYTRNAVVHNGVVDKGVNLIGKPFTIDELATRVREVLDQFD